MAELVVTTYYEIIASDASVLGCWKDQREEAQETFNQWARDCQPGELGLIAVDENGLVIELLAES